MRKVRIGNDINVRWEVKTDGQAVSLEGKALKLYVRSAYRKEEITTFTVEGCVVSFTYPASMQRMTGARAVILEDATEGAPRRTVCADQAFTLVAHSCEESDDDVEFEDFMVSLQSNVLIGKPGLSAYEVWLSEGNTGTLEDWYAFLRKPATDIAADVAEAEAERKAAETARQGDENLRKTAEENRASAETDRNDAEQRRIANENSRETAEQMRKRDEADRIRDEKEREAAEASRKAAEKLRDKAENDRTASEQTRQENETARVTAETERKSAEQERTTAETERTTSEQARQENETTRVSAETERVVAELSRQRAEAKREQAAKDNKAANDAAVAAAYAAADTADTATGEANAAATNADMATANANAAADAAEKVNAVLGDDNVLKVTDRTGAEKSLELVAQAAATEMAKKVEQNAADIAELSSKISEERTRVDGELEKKFAKADIVQEPGNSEELVMSQKAVSDKLKKLSTEIIYDVSAHNDGAVFNSLQALLNSSNLSTLIPSSVRCGGMSIRFVQSSDNKYVQYRLIANTFSTTVTDWQGVDDEPTTGSNNLVKSGGIADSINKLKNAGYLYAGIATPTTNPGTPEGHVFYIAKGKGTYTNFSGIDVTEDDVVVMYYDTAWHKNATGIASNDTLTKLDKDVNGINFSPVEVSGISPWGNNQILALDGYTMVYIPVKAGETFHLEASCTKAIRIGFTTQTPISGTPTTGYESFESRLSKDYTPIADGYFCMGAAAEITYEFSNPNPSLRQRVETLEERYENLDELSGTTIDMADINVLPGAYNKVGVLSWAENGFYHSEPIKVTKGNIFKGLGLKTTISMALLASVSEDGTWISNLLMGSATSPQDFEYIFTSDGYISICGYAKQNTIRSIATIVTKGAIDKINDIENEIETIPPFYIKESANLMNGVIFTKKGRWNWDKTWIVDDIFRTSGKILVDSTKSLYIAGSINYIVVAQFGSVESETPVIVNTYTTELPATLSLGATTKAIEISVRDYNVGVAFVGYGESSDYSRGFAPNIGLPGVEVSAVPAKLYDLQNTWKGKRYLSLGDSVSARDNWQKIVDFYLGTTHVNKAVSGTSIGTYAFNREGGGENTSDMEQAVATSLIPASELQSMDLIIIASYINSAVSLGPQADLGSMDDTFISISEESASDASSIDAYASSIAGQNFTQAARSTIEYVLKNCGKAKVLIVGDLQFAGGENYGTTNFEWVNNKGYNRRDFAKRMGEIAAYYGLPYVNLEECGGVNALNASEYYGDNIHPNFYPYYGGDNWTECGMKHESMPIIKAMIGM